MFFWFLLPGLIELFKTVVDQLDIEQVIHACRPLLNIVGLFCCAKRAKKVEQRVNSQN